VIIVIGHEKLLSDLKRKYPNPSQMTILKVSKSGGVVTRDKDVRRQFNLQRVKQYFYGVPTVELTPFSQTVPFTDVIVRRAVEGSIAPSSALPIGMEANPNEVKFLKVETGDILLHSVLAVTFAPLPGSDEALDEEGKPKLYTPEEETNIILKSNVSGFVFISEVDDKKRKLTVLSPNACRLPKTYMIMGTLKWMDG
jgi:polyribonucleotide 5'-hydroxyl-kinase